MIYVLTADPNLAARYVARLASEGIESVWYPPQELRERATATMPFFSRADEIHHLRGRDGDILASISSVAAALGRAGGWWRQIGYHGPALDDLPALQRWLNEDQAG